jgi:hypothetical protein
MAAAAARAEDMAARMIAAAGKDLATVLLLLPKLKDVEFHDFDLQLKRAAARFSWPMDYLFDLTLTAAQATTAHGQLSDKSLEDVKNAYTAITTLCMGHPVADTLESGCCGGGP